VRVAMRVAVRLVRCVRLLAFAICSILNVSKMLAQGLMPSQKTRANHLVLQSSLFVLLLTLLPGNHYTPQSAHSQTLLCLTVYLEFGALTSPAAPKPLLQQ
jgi:hypothetical protein